MLKRPKTKLEWIYTGYGVLLGLSLLANQNMYRAIANLERYHHASVRGMCGQAVQNRDTAILREHCLQSAISPRSRWENFKAGLHAALWMDFDDKEAGSYFGNRAVGVESPERPAP